MHLRRSDLPKGDTRATADEYYYRLAEEIRQIVPPESGTHVSEGLLTTAASWLWYHDTSGGSAMLVNLLVNLEAWM